MKKSTLILLFAVSVLVAGLLLSSCTDYLKSNVRGTQTANQKPVVYFVNIPPDGYKVSVNPVVHWVGTDADGLVTMFRYIVVTEEEMGGPGVDPADFALNVLPTYTESQWIYLDVTVNDPKTTNIVPAQASLTDPVNHFIRQFIFVQAFDDQGLGSDVTYREVYRNDYPPNTTESSLQDTGWTYINAAQPGAIGTGVKVAWKSTDPDLEDTLFEYEWKVYGPYDSAAYRQVIDSFVKPVFVTNDAKLYPIEDGGIIYIVDTSYTETGLVVDTVQTIIVDTITKGNLYGIYDTILDINDPDFTGDARYNKMVETSGSGSTTWIKGQSDSLYDLYRYEPLDSTDYRYFIFWVRGRDAAEVADLTPAYSGFKSLEPKYERDVLLLDFNANRMINRYVSPYVDSTVKRWDYDLMDSVPATPAVTYWTHAIRTWAAQSGLDINYAPAYPYLDGDYILVKRAANRVSLKQLLSHKLMILYNDDIALSGISDGIVPSTGLGANIYIAIDAGVNAFLTMRAPITGDKQGLENFKITPDAAYSRYFGVSELVYSGWGGHAVLSLGVADTPGSANFAKARRIEDFVGAIGMTDELGVSWPSLDIDTVRLRDMYYWNTIYPNTDGAGPCEHWINWVKHYESPFKWGGADTCAYRQYPLPEGLRALPEVDWAVRSYGTNIMFLYKSWYGRSHPLGEQFSFEGSPVGHRLNTGVFKTVHWSFTPLAMDTTVMQGVLNSVLSWLYEPNLMSPPAKIRYTDSKMPISLSKARAAYWKEVEETQKENVLMRQMSK